MTSPSRAVPNAVLRFVVPIVISLTVLPFTVGFFRRFTTLTDDGVRLLGIVPVVSLNELALPVAVLIMDVLAVRLAADFWSRRSVLLLGMFVAAQSIPTVAVYFDSRVADMQQIRAGAAEQLRVDPVEVAEAEHEHADELAQYNGAVARAERDKDRITGRLEQIEQAIAATDTRKRDALERLRVPGTLAEREAARTELDRLALEGDRERADLSKTQEALASLIANPPVPPVLRLPRPVAIPPPPESELAFIVRTMVSWDSFIALLVASMFTTFWMVTGYVLARMEGTLGGIRSGRGQHPLPLQGALAFYASLPDARQRSLVTLLATRLRVEFAVRRSLAELSVSELALEMVGREVTTELTDLATIRGAILASRIVLPARTILIGLVDELISTPMRVAPGTRDDADDQHAEAS